MLTGKFVPSFRRVLIAPRLVSVCPMKHVQLIGLFNHNLNDVGYKLPLSTFSIGKYLLKFRNSVLPSSGSYDPKMKELRFSETSVTRSTRHNISEDLNLY